MLTDRVKILLVDDEARNLDALEAILASPDYDLVRADSADQALLALLRKDFAALVLDIRMPGVSGLELARIVKQRKRTEHVPILFLTAHLLDEGDVLQGYGAGAVDYLSKPVNPDILRSKIAVFVDLFCKTRALAGANAALQNEIGERQKAQEALHVANEALETRVQERTADLTATNNALRQSEERLRDAHDSLRLAQRAGGGGVWDWNVVTGETYVSPEFRDIYGFKSGEPFSWEKWLAAVHPDEREHIAAARRTLLESGEEWNQEFRIRHPLRGERWFASIGRLTRDVQGRPLRFSGISLDITERKRTERELAHYRDRLEQLVGEQTRKLQQSMDQLRRSERLASVGTLATGIAHEINNPLNAIFLATQYGLRGLQPVDYVETLECIKREAERAGQIVKNLLRFTREEQTSKSPSDVNDMVQHVAGLIQSYLPVENFKLDLDLSSALPPVAMNTTEIEQVVVNLIKNAVEAGGGAVRVAIRTAAGNGQVTLSVADTGPGIPPEHQLHIFDPFFTTKRTSGGTGLGLSLCHTIVTEHGGRIYLQSEVGRGSTFTIEFPAAVLQSAEKSGDGAATAESGVPRSESDYVCQKSC